jgi:2-iminoacetate synthase ThiH
MKYLFGKSIHHTHEWLAAQSTQEGYRAIAGTQGLLGIRNSEVHLLPGHEQADNWEEFAEELFERVKTNNLRVVMRTEEEIHSCPS